MEDVPETIGKVCSFTTDEAAKNELLSALDALHSGTIQGHTRYLTAKWEAEGTWQDWQRHIEELKSEIADALPVHIRTNLDDAEAAIEGNPVKKKKIGRVMTAVFLVFPLLFTWLSLYLFLQGAGTAYRALNLRIRGQKDTAEVIQIACEMRPQKNDDIQNAQSIPILRL